jgi:hypothetical protein
MQLNIPGVKTVAQLLDRCSDFSLYKDDPDTATNSVMISISKVNRQVFSSVDVTGAGSRIVVGNSSGMAGVTIWSGSEHVSSRDTLKDDEMMIVVGLYSGKKNLHVYRPGKIHIKSAIQLLHILEHEEDKIKDEKDLIEAAKRAGVEMK